MNFFNKRKELVALLVVLVGANAWAAERVIEKSFSFEPGGEVVLKVAGGDVEVRSKNSPGVSLYAVATGSRSAVDQFKLDIDEGSDELRIIQRKQTMGGWFRNLSVRVQLEVPRQCQLRVRTSGGDVEIDEIDGVVEARSSGGDLRFGRIDGPLLADTSGGNVKAQWILGDAELTTSGGDIFVAEMEGNLLARTSGGNVDIEGVDGRIQTSSSGGNIRLRLLGSNRGIEARTSGGNIRLEASPNLKGRLFARTSGGRVVSDFSVSTRGRFSKNRVEGTINGGTTEIVLKTSGGRIELREIGE